MTFRIEHTLPVLHNIPIIWTRDIEGAAGDIENRIVVYGTRRDGIRCKCRDDVEVSIIHERIIRRGCRHFKFSVPGKVRHHQERGVPMDGNWI